MNVDFKKNRFILSQLNSINLRIENFKNIGKRVGFYLLVGNIASILVQLLLVPVLLFYWGASLYGEWVVLSSIPAMFALMDFGIIAVSNNLIDKYCAEKKFISANRVYYSSIFLLFLIFLMFIVFSLLIFFFFNNYIIEIFTKTDVGIVGFLFFLMVFDCMQSIFLNHHSALYRTINKFHWTSNWQNLSRVIPMFFVMLVAVSGNFILEAAIIMVFVRLLILIAMLIDMKFRLYWIKSQWFYFSNRVFKKILKKSIGFMTLPLSNLMVLHVTTMLIAISYNTSIVALFNSLRTFTRLIPQLVSIVGRSLWSEISKIKDSNVSDVEKIYKYILLRTIVIALFFMFFYLLIGEDFYLLWTHGELGFDNNLFILLVLNAIGIAIYTSLEVVLLARNKVSSYSIVFFVISIAQVLLGWFMSSKIGISSYPLFGFLATVSIVLYLIFLIRKGEKCE